jgi:tRNA-dihydrouridine synthase B
LVQEILTAVVSAVEIPVTLKMRTGWSRSDRNGLEIARLAEDCGIAALSIHGRTRECGFNGSAEFDTIAEIKSEVGIPVIANGDIDSLEKAEWVMKHTRADAVMIGRAAQGNPWLPGAIDHYLLTGNSSKVPSKEEVSQCFQKHIAALHEFYGEYSGVRIARKHLGWYVRTHAGNEDFRRYFNQLDSAAEQIIASQRYFELEKWSAQTITQKDLAA